MKYSIVLGSFFIIIFLAGCAQLTATNSVLATQLNKDPSDSSLTHNGQSNGQHFGRNGQLTRLELGIAKIAWRYFENNYQASTGLVNAVDDFPSTTLWDTASYMGALVAAYELKLINQKTFDARLSKLLDTFNSLSFFENTLPHKVYHTKTLAKVTYANKPGEIGFSGLDLGRLLIWLKIIKERYPHYSQRIDKFVLRWDFKQVIDAQGYIYGAARDTSTEQVNKVQEGRLGYEEYCAKGFNLWGFKTTQASKAAPFKIVSIYGIEIPYDARAPQEYFAHNSVVSEGYILDGIEFNWDLALDNNKDDTYHSHPWLFQIAENIYQVQALRYKQTNKFTARTEHQLDQKPYFVYDSIYSDGKEWATVTEKGEYVPQFAAVALKAVIGLWVMWQTEYTDALFKKYIGVYDKDKGFYEGLYENGTGAIKKFTANNNGIILEALLYKVQGKLLRFNNQPSLWDEKHPEFFN